MKQFAVRIRDEMYCFTGNISPIQSLVDGIRNSRSTNPQALPLRGSRDETLPDWVVDSNSREINRSHYSALRKSFLREKLLLDTNALRGLYFFLRLFPKPTKYYYIGIANPLARRIRNEHLRNKDFIFYSISYPQNRERYLKEVLCFYGSKPKYAHLKGEYIRESDCLKEVMFDRIAWVGCNEFEKKTWEEIETHFVSNKDYKPCCNVRKKSVYPADEFRPEFDAVQNVLDQLLNDDR